MRQTIDKAVEDIFNDFKHSKFLEYFRAYNKKYPLYALKYFQKICEQVNDNLKLELYSNKDVELLVTKYYDNFPAFLANKPKKEFAYLTHYESGQHNEKQTT